MTKWNNDALAACIGKTVTEVDGLSVGSECVMFTFEDSSVLRMYHSQDCCESVNVVQIDGESADLMEAPLVMAEIVSSDDAPAPEHAESYSWTFVKFATSKGYVTVRWLGESNGYYGETPSITLEAP